MSRNYEIVCDPPPGVEGVEGFQFHRDQNGVVVARCVLCRAGFVVGEDSALAVRNSMIVHLAGVHRCGCLDRQKVGRPSCPCSFYSGAVWR
jgi:hypothetical protein